MHLFDMVSPDFGLYWLRRRGLQFLLFMKLTLIFLLAGTLFASAKGVGQNVTLHLNNVSLQQTFREIQRQTGYTFLYTKQMVENTAKVTVHVNNVSIAEALSECLKKQGLDFAIDDKIVVLRRRPKAVSIATPAQVPSDTTGDVRGVVLNEGNSPLQGATIKITALNKSTYSNARGEFVLSKLPPGKYNLEISYVGFDDYTGTITVNGNSVNLTAALKQVLSNLDEVHVIAYGTATKRFSTGDQTSFKSQDIEKQPVTNPIAALQGRMTGVLVTNANGIPGSAITMQIRGNYSLSSRADPLYIVDGVPYPAVSLSNVQTASGAVSPFNSINTMDIESISVLKDADATAIYGSRGANGVVLITTKKGKVGKTSFDVNAYSGSSVATRVPEFLNTDQYLEIRRKAFAADNITPGPSNAQDLLSWDQSAYTNFPKMILGNTAPFSNIQASASGGNENTRLLLSLGYHNEGSVIFGNNYDKRVSGHMNVDHYSTNKKLNINTSVTYSSDNIKTLANDPFLAIYAPPNFPQYDSTGLSLYWIPRDAQANTANPWSYLNKVGRTWTDNFMSNMALRYTILPGLNAKVNVGFSKLFMTQQVTMPTTAFNTIPSVAAPYKSYASFGNNSNQTYIVEPQLDYTKRLGGATINALAGGTAQSSLLKGSTITGVNFSTDDLIESISAGSIYDKNNSSKQYKYISGFGRLTLRWLDRYIVNGTFRRDGSSRFGPGKQFGNFWSIGGAYIFSEEHIIKQYLPVLSFGKFRASYGITGSDQIPDYRYLELYTSNTNSYNGTQGLYASQIANPVFGWEANRKLEVAMDLGFLKDRFLLSATWYRNRSDNQLVQSPLPTQTGFDYYQANLPALIEMTSLEFELNTVNIAKRDLRWQTTFNITFPDNKLIDFPNLASSPYAQTYVVGEPLRLARGYHYLGINSANGVPQFEDQNKDGLYNGKDDYVNIGSLSPKFYGGFGNTVTWKGFSLDIFIQFAKQNGYNAFRAFYFPPGYKVNVPSFYVKDYWEPSHTDATQAALSTTVSSSAGAGYAFPNRYYYSDAAYSDASYWRLKNLSFSYTLPKKLTGKMHMENLRLYVQGQNLFTHTDYEGLDPETQNATPVLKTLTGGIQITL
jgi:TonB-linked SusC/RagA family outer membrane protein